MKPIKIICIFVIITITFLFSTACKQKPITDANPTFSVPVVEPQIIPERVTDKVYKPLEFDASKYLGEWICSNGTDSPKEIIDKGGIIVEITQIQGNYIKGKYTNVQLKPNNTAAFEFEGNIENKTLHYKFKDSLLNTGELVLAFLNESVDVDLLDFALGDKKNYNWQKGNSILKRSRSLTSESIKNAETIELTNNSAADYLVLEKIKGIYVNKKYIQILAENKSPLKTIKLLSGRQLVFWLEYKNNTWLLQGTQDLHQGGFPQGTVYKVVKTSIKTEIYFNSQSGKEVLVIEEAAEGLSIKYNDKEQQFMKVDSENNYIGDMLFKGAWQSEDGKKYIFEDNAVANFDNRKFPYQINIDPAVVCDYIVDSSQKGKFYAFEFKDGMLYLFNTHLESVVIKEDKPFVILKKLEK